MNRKFSFALAMSILISVSGCLLDRSPLGVPLDSAIPDAHTLDGDMLDSGVDAFVADADAGPMPDAWIDPDGGLDAGSDAGTPPPDAGMRRCEDTTSGICLRFQNAAGSPEVTGWRIQFYWTVTGGAIFRIPDNRDPEGLTVFASACSVLRSIDARTTECEITVPDPGMATLGAGPFYAYPTYTSGPACTVTSCPVYPSGYRMWVDGVERSTAPADGNMSQESRPTTFGSIIVLRITP